MKSMRWIVLGVCLAACMANVRQTWRDCQQFGGTDLRVRVVGARALISGQNPYTLKNSNDIDVQLLDPDQTILNRCTYPPTLLLFYAPLAAIDYELQRQIWMVLEWSALALAVTMLSLTIRSRQTRFWFVAGAVGLIGSSHFWRLHVERGQYYVFVLLSLSLGMYFILHGRRPVVAGIFFGLAACLRPPAVLFIVPLWWTRSHRASSTAVATLCAGVLLSTRWSGLEYWQDFIALSRSWELAVLGQSFDVIPLMDLPNSVDGYRRQFLEDFTPNLSMASVTRGLLGTEHPVNLSTLAAIIKVCWLVLLGLLAVGVCRGNWRRTVSERFALLFGATAMLLTDYFLPIRIEYADVLFCIPLALLAPMLITKRHMAFSGAVVVAFLLSAIRTQDLPSQYISSVTALRNIVVMSVTLRFLLFIPGRKVHPVSADPEDCHLKQSPGVSSPSA